MKVSNQSFALRKAHKKGYTINNDGTPLDPRGNIIPPNTDKDGYYYFSFKYRRNSTDMLGRVYLHRLQAYQKYGDAVINKTIHCRHVNGNKLDNSYNNIFIGDAADNRRDFIRNNGGRRSKTITLLKKSFGRYELVLKKSIRK